MEGQGRGCEGGEGKAGKEKRREGEGGEKGLSCSRRSRRRAADQGQRAFEEGATRPQVGVRPGRQPGGHQQHQQLGTPEEEPSRQGLDTLLR